jgi:hypothetical protein
MAVHACGLVIAGLVFTRLPVGRPPPPHEPGNPVRIAPGTLGGLVGVAGVGLAVLVVGQLFTRGPGPEVTVFTGHSSPGTRIRLEPIGLNGENGATRPATTESPVVEDEDPPALPDASPPKQAGPFHEFHNGAVKIDQSMFPVAGDPNAKHVMAVLADYTCPDCKRLHAILGETRRRYGEGTIAVIVMPMPLDSTCNPHVTVTPKKHENACELAKLALAVWAAEPAKFAEMDEWLMDNQPADPAEARRKAVELVGEAALAEAESGTAADAALRESTRAYGTMNSGPIPKLMIVPKVTAVGRVDNASDVYNLLEKHLGVKPVE